MCNRVVIVCAVGIAAVLGGADQRGPGPVSVKVAFRTVLHDGKAVVDLSASELSAELDGRRTAVTALSVVSTPAGDPEKPRIETRATPFVTNTSTVPRRNVLLYVDGGSIDAAGHNELQRAVGAWLARLDSDDRVGLVSSRNADLRVPPTLNRGTIAGALRKLAVQRLGSQPCAFDEFLGRLESMLSAAASDSPMTVVFFTGDVGGCDRGVSPGRRNDLNRLGQVAKSAAVDMYVVYVTSQIDDGPTILHNLVDVTGGEFLRLTSGLDVVLRQTAAFYVATLEIPAAEFDDSVHRLAIASDRDGVNIRVQRWIRLQKMALAAPGVTAVGAILRSPVDRRDLSLRVKTLVSPNLTDGRVRVLTMFETVDPSAAMSAAMLGVYDDDGNTVAQWSARAGELRQPITLASVLVRPGVYRVRLAAGSTDGRMGTVEERVRAEPVVIGQAGISDIVLAVERDQELRPVLEVEGDEFVAVCEIYNVPADAHVGATMDLAATNGGQSLAVADTTLRQSSDAGRWVLTGRFRVDAIGQGEREFVVRANVVINGSAAQVTRAGRRR